MALFPKYCEQGAPSNVRVLRLVAHCKSQRLAQDKILVIDIISRQIIGEYEAGDSPDGIGYSSLVVGSGAGE